MPVCFSLFKFLKQSLYHQLFLKSLPRSIFPCFSFSFFSLYRIENWVRSKRPSAIFVVF
jgi:hypothetical protein